MGGKINTSEVKVVVVKILSTLILQQRCHNALWTNNIETMKLTSIVVFFAAVVFPGPSSIWSHTV